MATKTEKLPYKSYAHSKWSYVGKVPKLIFVKLSQKIVQFEVFLVEKVPKSSVFNQECFETSNL